MWPFGKKQDDKRSDDRLPPYTRGLIDGLENDATGSDNPYYGPWDRDRYNEWQRGWRAGREKKHGKR